MQTILILNGPNLNMLGQREPEIYGHETLEDIQKLCEDKASDLGVRVHFRQSNHEGELVTWIQQAAQSPGPYAGIIINAAAYTHTSIAIHDALKLLNIPIIEVHISDPETREDFRHTSFITPVAAAVYKGLGANGYAKSLEHISDLIHTQ